MIYTSSLGLDPTRLQSRPVAEALRRVAARARAIGTQVVELMRKAIAQSRAALARNNSFGAQ